MSGNTATVFIKKLYGDAQLPEYKTERAAGCDLYLYEKVVLHPGEKVLAKTGIAVELLDGFEGQIRPRSSLAKLGIIIPNSPGTIDSDYRGEVCVWLYNIGFDSVTLEKGDRVAQMVIAPVFQATFVEVSDLNQTQRGEGGFGSTGRN